MPNLYQNFDRMNICESSYSCDPPAQERPRGVFKKFQHHNKSPNKINNGRQQFTENSMNLCSPSENGVYNKRNPQWKTATVIREDLCPQNDSDSRKSWDGHARNRSLSGKSNGSGSDADQFYAADFANPSPTQQCYPSKQQKSPSSDMENLERRQSGENFHVAKSSTQVKKLGPSAEANRVETANYREQLEEDACYQIHKESSSKEDHWSIFEKQSESPSPTYPEPRNTYVEPRQGKAPSVVSEARRPEIHERAKDSREHLHSHNNEQVRRQSEVDEEDGKNHEQVQKRERFIRDESHDYASGSNLESRGRNFYSDNTRDTRKEPNSDIQLQESTGSTRGGRGGMTNRGASSGRDPRSRRRFIPRQKLENELFSSTYNIEQGPYFDDTYSEFSPNIIGGDAGHAPMEYIERFEDCKFADAIMKNIQQKGYEKLTPIQKCCIPIILKKRKYDLMAHANTGSGKTAAFLLPIIDILQEWKMNNNHYSNSNSPLALILAPTRDLCQQHYEEARAFTIGTRVHVAACYGEYDIPQNLRDIRHGCDILCATSGRLLQFLSDGHIKLDKLLFFVMDEADRLLQDSFIQDIEMLHRSFAENPARKTYMFSATYNEEVQGMAKKFLNANYFFVRIGILNSAVQNVEQNFIEVTQQDKRDLLKELLESNATRVVDEDTGNERLLVPKTMIFVEQKRCCDRLACTLLTMNIICQSLNSDRNQKQREEALNMFVKGDIDVLVCTNVAARGLNIKGVKHVINYDLPWDRDNYVHRIGRTGRVGHKGMSTSFIVSTNYREIQMAHELIDILNEVGQTPPKFLEDMAMISKIRRNSGNRAVAAPAPRYSPPSYEETPFEW